MTYFWVSAKIGLILTLTVLKSPVMPNLQNAMKALRQANVRAERNKKRMNAIETMRRSFRIKLEAGKVDEAKELGVQIFQAVDKAAGKGLIKGNTAARIKSRISTRLNAKTAK